LCVIIITPSLTRCVTIDHKIKYMSVAIEQYPEIELDVFQDLDLHTAWHLRPNAGEIAAFGGRCAVGQLEIIQTPPSLQSTNEILTNPTQIEFEPVILNGATVMLPTLYGRGERAFQHLGTSRACKYAVVRHRDGTIALTEIDGFNEIPGEDPRRARVRMPGHLGVHDGEMLSVVEASAKPDNPEQILGIEQKFYFAPSETPNKFELVAVGPNGVKCTTVFALDRSEDDTGVGFFGRPHPTLSYGEVSDPTKLNPEVIESAVKIPNLLPTDSPLPYHTGTHFVEKIGKDRVRVRTHQACVDRSPRNAKILYYRLSDLGYHLPNHEYPAGRPTALGVTATAAMFDIHLARLGLSPKVPEGDVEDYRHILYGAANGHLTTGVGDQHLGYGRTRYDRHDKTLLHQLEALRLSSAPKNGRRYFI